jgi:drug/metabolite transporter superfamily protein YnfA
VSSSISLKIILLLLRVYPPLLTKLITTDENDRTVASFGAIFLVFSILCSPSLQRFFAKAPFVFFGNLSFAMYLLHGMFIRIPLQWTVIYILPALVSDAVKYNVTEGSTTAVELLCESWNCQFTMAILLLAWFGLLVVSCIIWKKYVDVLGIQFSTWGEEVVTGKRKVHLNVEYLTVFTQFFKKEAGEPWLWVKNSLIDIKKDQ